MAAKVVDFPVPVGPVTKTKAFGFFKQFIGHRRNSQFRKIEDIEGDGSKGSCHGSPLHKDIPSETAQSFDPK